MILGIVYVVFLGKCLDSPKHPPCMEWKFPVRLEGSYSLLLSSCLPAANT